MKEKNTMKKTTIKKLKQMIKTDLKKNGQNQKMVKVTNYFINLNN
jgi:hypothetical protein